MLDDEDEETRAREIESEVVDNTQEIIRRQEILFRRNHNKDWIRRYQDNSAKYRTLNLCNFMNARKGGREKERERECVHASHAINCSEFEKETSFAFDV